MERRGKVLRYLDRIGNRFGSRELGQDGAMCVEDNEIDGRSVEDKQEGCKMRLRGSMQEVRREVKSC